MRLHMIPVPRPDLLVSVRPRFAHAILEGTKRVELRRVRPAVEAGDTIVFYETSPTCAVVAKAEIRNVASGSATRLWTAARALSGLNRQEFMLYFEGCRTGFAIEFGDVRVFEHPVTLSTLRRAVPGFAPPQSYHYLRRDRSKDRRLAAYL